MGALEIVCGKADGLMFDDNVGTSISESMAQPLHHVTEGLGVGYVMAQAFADFKKPYFAVIR